MTFVIKVKDHLSTVIISTRPSIPTVPGEMLDESGDHHAHCKSQFTICAYDVCKVSRFSWENDGRRSTTKIPQVYHSSII